MNSSRRSLGRKAFVVGFMTVIVTAWWGGCSKSGSSSVNLTKARESLRKRWADYGELPVSEPRATHQAPVRGR